MQRNTRRSRNYNRQKITYKPENCPSHFKRTAHYLKQLREDGDFRQCDIELVTDGGSEIVHSAIAAAHCAKIAKLLEVHDTPLRIDVRGYRRESVSKVVEWMYSGQAEIFTNEMEEQMSLTNYLGVVFLHHLLENSLKSISAEPKMRIEAINIATHPKTGVSPETIASILRIFHENHATLSLDEIKHLQPWAIRRLVSTPVKTPTKIALLNIALSWLRLSQNIRHLDYITSSISIEDMYIRELTAFQRTLRAVLLNPTTRRFATVSVEKSGIVAINMDRSSYIRHAGVTVERTESESALSAQSKTQPSQKESSFKPLLPQERNQEFSKFSLNDLPSYSHRSTPQRTSVDCQENDDSQSDASDGLENDAVLLSESMARELATLPPSAGKDFCSPSNQDRRFQYTRSEIEELQNYPDDVFTKTPSPNSAAYSSASSSENRKDLQKFEIPGENAKDLPKNKEEPPLVAASPQSIDFVGTGENAPKYVMSHYAF
ncbi:hypothetical protein RB195_000064 [Necator americanus]|uniref:BTB domain-containing protein n=1 Tax=Necator americanus TaxID=51031 RepID=A0ABR1D7T0_NECAM